MYENGCSWLKIDLYRSTWPVPIFLRNRIGKEGTFKESQCKAVRGQKPVPKAKERSSILAQESA